MTLSSRSESDEIPAPESARQILIVEDDKDLAGLLRHWIDTNATEETTVTTAASIQASREALANLPALDIVLLDRRLPWGMGDELLSTIDESFDAIVVMITGMEPDADLIRLPVTDYLVKPIDEAVLIKRLALLEKLAISDGIEEYTNARKAALLEYHLPDPTASPLFRRFAAQWEYDRLEIAIDRAHSYVYELYVDETDSNASISVVGRLSKQPEDLVDQGVITRIGEVLPSGESHAWIDATAGEPVDYPDNGFAVYRFDHENPEAFVDRAPSDAATDVERALEQAYG